ncbi:MAG: hypothetical protein ACXVFN_15100 [Solirubrobacteraceae bacterium]
MPSSDRARLPLAPIILAMVALAAETATHLADFGWHLRVRLLDSSYEWSYSHLLATAAFAAGTVICARAAATGQRRRAWAVGAGAFGVLLVDNVTRLHAHIPHWPAVFGPILATLCVALLRAARGTSAERLVAVGVGLLFLSLAIHVLGPALVHALGWSDQSWGYQIKVALKEGTELAGWVLLVPALLRAARQTARQAA